MCCTNDGIDGQDDSIHAIGLSEHNKEVSILRFCKSLFWKIVKGAIVIYLRLMNEGQ